MIIGLRALLTLQDQEISENPEFTLIKASLPPGMFTKRTLKKQKKGVRLDPYLPHINSSISYILTTLDTHYGNLLLFNQTKALSGMQKKITYLLISLHHRITSKVCLWKLWN
jgi:hypothetical protein